jgi:two-component system sensor histidine kinase MprB
MSLRWRIAAALAAVAAVIGGLVAVGAYVSVAGQLRSSIDESLASRASALDSSQPSRDGDGDRGPRHGGPAAHGPAGSGCPDPGDFRPASAAQLVASDGTVTPCITGAPTLPTTGIGNIGVRSTRWQTATVDGESYRILTTRWSNGQVVQLGRSLTESGQVLDDLRLQLALVVGSGAVLAGVLGWWIARRMARPIVRLRDTAEAIATTQDLHTAIPDGGDGEVGSLSRSFTTMVAALAASREQQQRLVADASHEMRTPLTSLTSNLELLEQFDRLPAADRQEVVAAVGTELGELTHLLTDLVELASGPSAYDEPTEDLLLADVARDVARRASRRSGREITVDATDTTTVSVRPQMIERAVSNLVENAVKYSPPGSPVVITVAGTRLTVRDHGPGIAAEDQPHVFERFYRAAGARSAPGSGLGLAIVDQTVRRHAGRLLLTNDPGGGAIVGFELPPAGRP